MAGWLTALLLAWPLLPPIEYQRNNGARIVFATRQELHRRCSSSHAAACTDKIGDEWIIFMPNPCNEPKREAYAMKLCHELGHVNGWPADHGKRD